MKVTLSYMAEVNAQAVAKKAIGIYGEGRVRTFRSNQFHVEIKGVDAFFSNYRSNRVRLDGTLFQEPEDVSIES